MTQPDPSRSGRRPARPPVCRACLSDARDVGRRTNPDGSACHFVDDGGPGLICSRCVALLAGVPLHPTREGGDR